MRNFFTIALVFMCTSMVFSQKIKIEKGGFEFLKGQKEINVEFDYSQMVVFIKKKDHTNQEYIDARVEDLESRSRGTGKAWQQKWESSPESLYEPKFLDLMNKYVNEKKGIAFGKGLDGAKYTLIVKVVWVYPGYNVGVMKQPAKVTTLLQFVETANKDNVVLEITSKEAPGDVYGGAFDNEFKIGESFAKTGKTLAGILLKKIK